MKRHFGWRRSVAFFCILLVVAALGYFFIPSYSAWDVAGLVQRYDNPDTVMWITDDHHHVPKKEQRKEAGKILDGLKMTRKVGARSLSESHPNVICIEEGPKKIQYFFFNEDFTLVWCCDSTMVDEYFDTSVVPVSDIYIVKNPWKIRAYFEKICETDPKTQLLESIQADSNE